MKSKHRRRNGQLARAWRLVNTLRGAGEIGVALDALAQRLSVSTRTIRRDISALEELHMPIVQDGDRFSYMPSAGCPACGRSAVYP